MGKANVVLLSDFGSADLRTVSYEGVIKHVDPLLDVYPANIWIPRQDLRAAAGVLYSTAPFWPAGTVFLTEVRKSGQDSVRELALRLANGCIALAPDNGLLTMVIQSLKVDAIRAVDPALLSGPFPIAELAGRLAAGQLSFDALGAAVTPEEICLFDLTPPVLAPGLAEGAISLVMRNFGNLTCNISIDEFERTGIVSGDTVRLTVTLDGQTLFDQSVLYHRSFGFAPPGEPIVFNGSSGFMGFGLNQASFVQAYLPHIMEEGVDPFDYKVRIEKQ